MSQNIETVTRYLDGFRKNDHAQILSCLTDDIEWNVFGAFHLTGKDAYDKAIDGGAAFIDPPELTVVRMVEQGRSSAIGCAPCCRPSGRSRRQPQPCHRPATWLGSGGWTSRSSRRAPRMCSNSASVEPLSRARTRATS